jgi:flagellar hook-basal body complex protein FliE
MKAYAAAQAAAPLQPPPAAAAGPDFGQMVSSALKDAVGASRNAEAQMAAQVQGKASLVDVVTAISSAETSLQTVISIRDQVIASYQQIMNMPI